MKYLATYKMNHGNTVFEADSPEEASCFAEQLDYANPTSFDIESAYDLWEEFGDVPMNPGTECIEEPWRDFPAGTHREDIWHWFEDTFDIRVYDLMYQ